MDRDVVVELYGEFHPVALAIPDGTGWAVVAAFRPTTAKAGHAAPRVLKMLVDCSGSMAGDYDNLSTEELARLFDEKAAEYRVSIEGVTYAPYLESLSTEELAKLFATKPRLAPTAAVRFQAAETSG